MPISSAIASAAACFNRSLSSVRGSFFFDSSSSLSTRLNGSWSATGLGSTAESGCHLLDLPPPEAGRFVESGDARYGVSISSGGPSWNETLRPFPDCGRGGVGLNNSGLAKGLVDRLGGSVTCKLEHYIWGALELPS